MKLNRLIISKSLKVGLPNYSNFSLSMEFEITPEEGEKINYENIFTRINLELDKEVKRELLKQKQKYEQK